jgi:biotin carboxyl carrier protein
MTSSPRTPLRGLRISLAPANRLPDDMPLDVDPSAAAAVVEPWGPGRAVVHTDDGRDIWALIGEDRPSTRARPRTVEVVVDGWRFELEVEDAARADLRARATRTRPSGLTSGPLEVRAMIPGRVVAVAVAVGDTVVAGETLLVVEAMKMQNELRAPRDGRVEGLSVGVGETIDLGDLLVTLA